MDDQVKKEKERKNRYQFLFSKNLISPQEHLFLPQRPAEG